MVISDFFMHFPYIYFFRHIHRNTQICTFKTNLLFSFMRKELHTQLSRLCTKLFIFSSIILFDYSTVGLDQSIDIGCSERTVISSVTWFSCFSPDHTSVIRAEISVKSSLYQCFHNRIHIKRSILCQMSRLFK